MALIAEREREIATLRLKFCTNDEELKRLRKRNISLHNPNQDERKTSNNNLFSEAKALDKSGIQLPFISNNSSYNKKNFLTSSNKKNSKILTNNNNNQGTPTETDGFGDGNPFFKIKFIRTLREWAVYWKYYHDNHPCRLQLLEKLLSTETLRQEFSEASDIKIRVISDSLHSNNDDMQETTTHLMAELLDIHCLNEFEVKSINPTLIIIKNLRP